MSEEELKTKRLKIYLAPLLPINPPLIEKLDKSLIDINNSQLFIYSEDIYRELFSYILLNKGKEIDKKPTYKLVTIDDLVSQHFSNEVLKPLCFPDLLFIVYSSGYTGNPIYGPVFNKVVEERKMLNKQTYMFFKGSFDKAKLLGITENVNVVNYGSSIITSISSRTTQLQQFNLIGTPTKAELAEEKQLKKSRGTRKSVSKTEKPKEEDPNTFTIKSVDSKKYGGVL